MTEANHDDLWALGKRENGDVYDKHVTYGQRCVVYRRLVDGVAVPD